MRIGLSARFWLVVLVFLLACIALGLMTWRKQIAGRVGQFVSSP